MDKDLVRDLLEKSRFSNVQADILSKIFADMESRLATKADLAILRSELRSELSDGLNSIRTELHKMEARLTWRMIAVVTFLGAVMTLVGMFVP